MLGQTDSPIRTFPDAVGPLVYAVGDVHGRLDLLDKLLAYIERDAEGETYSLLFLGDYVDRGSDPAGVIERLAALSDQPRPWTGTLAGNHEILLLEFLATPAVGAMWLDHGGRSTLASYGVGAPRLRADTDDWTRAAADLSEAMPARHLALLKNLTLAYEWKRFLFVHAGVRPGVALDQQTTNDLTSIRNPFLGARHPAPSRVVVFGHTPTEAVWAKDGKISVDTGAYATGVLSAVRIFEDEVAVLDSREERRPLDLSLL